MSVYFSNFDRRNSEFVSQCCELSVLLFFDWWFVAVVLFCSCCPKTQHGETKEQQSVD